MEIMGAATGASRASYFRIRKRLEEEGRLRVEGVAPIRLGRTRRPGIPARVELDSMAAARPGAPEEEPRPVDIPVGRAEFERPVRGQPPPPRTPQLPGDTLSWERPASQDEDDDEGGDA
jgi:hypothetical protein